MYMKRETRIAVIGGGLEGATAAVLLQREGFQVRLFEQARVLVKFGKKLKLTKHQREEALARREAGELLVEIGRSFNVSHSTISRQA